MEDFLQQLPRNLFLYIGAGIFALIMTYRFFPKVFLKIHKPFFFTLGILSLSLGYVGILIPGLPTTVFILIAAWAFSKCSDRFTAWLENHRLFGPMILNWKTYRGLSRRAKKLAILMIIPTFVLTIFLVFSLVGDLIFGSFGIVLCYGLRTDFRGEPFPGSIYLLGWADELIELKTICKSGKKATFNARLDENGNRVTEGDQISIGLNYEAQARDVFELDKVSPIDYQIPEAN